MSKVVHRVSTNTMMQPTTRAAMSCCCVRQISLPSLAGQGKIAAEVCFAACTGAFGLFRTAYHEGGDNMRLLLDNTLPHKLAPVTGIEQPFESELHPLASQHALLLRASHMT